MAQSKKSLSRIRYVSDAVLERLANTEPPGGEVYYEGDYLVIKRRDGSIERYGERQVRPPSKP